MLEHGGLRATGDSALAFLIEHHAASLRPAAAGRSGPPLPLSRLRAAGKLTELLR